MENYIKYFEDGKVINPYYIIQVKDGKSGFMASPWYVDLRNLYNITKNYKDVSSKMEKALPKDSKVVSDNSSFDWRDFLYQTLNGFGAYNIPRGQLMADLSTSNPVKGS